MFVFEPGAGCTGVPRLVQPGEDLVLSGQSEQIDISDLFDTKPSVRGSDSTQVNEVAMSDVGIKRAFNVPLPKEKLDDLSHKNFSDETGKKIKWATKMYREWRMHRHSLGLEFIACDLDEVDTISYDSLVFALSRFLTEVKKVDGTDFPGKTL